MHSKYGPSLRSLLQIVRPHNYEDMVGREVDKLTLKELNDILCPSNARDYSHLLVSTMPSETNRALSKQEVASPYFPKKFTPKSSWAGGGGKKSSARCCRTNRR